MSSEFDKFDPYAALRTLLDAGVRFVVIGGMAGRTWGSPRITNDLDICYDRESSNLTSLVKALKVLEATLRGAPTGLPFILDERTLKFGDCFTFETTAGPLDCLGTPTGTKGYADLLADSAEFEIDGMIIRFASIDDLIRMKRASDRLKDRDDVMILEAVRDELRNRS
jgi:hypothetical protein